MKYLKWAGNNILFVLTLFLLAFIPLYPKKPLVDIVNTWVYIRAEDFVVAIVLFVWAILLFQKKITLKTPLTLPILLFWAAGAIATLHGILIIFPDTADIFSNVAFLSYVRHIEYVSLFFIAWAGMKDKRLLAPAVWVLVLSLLGVILYGVGQKYAGFPAYLTMNEEVAKGTPITISAMGRVASTFAGHYDLAAYLVLVIPIVVSLVFGIKNWLLKIGLVLCAVAGFWLTYMTVSRISFFALVVAICIVVFLQKRKLLLLAIPMLLVGAFFLASYAPALLQRFGSTVKEVDVLVHAKTGGVIGHPKVVPNTYFENRTIKRQFLLERELQATLSGTVASPSASIPYQLLPPEVLLISTENESTGENLPSGSGYINLPLSPVIKRVGYYFYDPSKGDGTTQSVLIIDGDFIIKRALAYDLSFTTRFQGEWPHALEAFKRNILLGSGYASVSLAVDNNYLRILAETGLIGFLTFFGIFVVIGIYIRKILPDINSKLARGFIIGSAAGVVGLMLNAFLIDVFDASKVAFYLWMIAGLVVAVLGFYQKSPIHLKSELTKLLVSPMATIILLSLLSIVMFIPILSNYFIGDDFTWLRWAATENLAESGKSFTQSDGFFYRPGTKLLFSVLYNIFWLNPAIYHAVSLVLHLGVAILVFFLSRKILKSWAWGTITSLLFLALSGYSEAIFWISSVGFLFTAFFSLASLLLFIRWLEVKNILYLLFSVAATTTSLFFHELGIVTPLLCLLYLVIFDNLRHLHKQSKYYLAIFLPIPLYLLVRYFSNSHWLSGDYDYNVLKLPFNAAGNLIGYMLVSGLGTEANSLYQSLRASLRDNLFMSAIFLVGSIGLVMVLFRKFGKKIKDEDKKIILFGLLFFCIALLPFLGLGNITSRYSYFAAVGFSILLVFFLRKFYFYLLPNGQTSAALIVSIVTIIFALFHVIQIQKAQGDWNTAGKKVQNFVISIDASYDDYWAEEPMVFYFVNTPIRHGEAWVFPVGLSDIVWFTFRNPNITVNQTSSLTEALDVAKVSKNEKIFIFNDEGRVTERKKAAPVVIQ